jgi:hypothetical protein
VRGTISCLDGPTASYVAQKSIRTEKVQLESHEVDGIIVVVEEDGDRTAAACHTFLPPSSSPQLDPRCCCSSSGTHQGPRKQSWWGAALWMPLLVTPRTACSACSYGSNRTASCLRIMAHSQPSLSVSHVDLDRKGWTPAVVFSFHGRFWVVTARVWEAGKGVACSRAQFMVRRWVRVQKKHDRPPPTHSLHIVKSGRNRSLKRKIKACVGKWE